MSEDISVFHQTWKIWRLEQQVDSYKCMWYDEKYDADYLREELNELKAENARLQAYLSTKEE